MQNILTIAGARPNFIKIAPLYRELEKHKDKFIHKICHTGQHFDENMSKIFFHDLELPEPDFNLGVGSGSQAEQTAGIMIKFEEVCVKEKPDLIIVVGDVNSTLACSLVAAKTGIKIAHVESGLRSFDRTMPEEINRMVTDTLSDFLFVTEPTGIQNLKNEGIDDLKVHFTGNIMIDSLVHYLPRIEKSDISVKMNIEKNNYVLVTFHRPSNVDNKDELQRVTGFLNRLAENIKVVFPVHPRTRNNIKEHGLSDSFHNNIVLTEPVGYIDFMALTKNAKLVITDSGGIQEETTFLGVQCITVRDNTERPVTVDVGTNHLAGTDLKKVEKIAAEILKGNIKEGRIPELWDGRVAARIVNILVD